MRDGHGIVIAGKSHGLPCPAKQARFAGSFMSLFSIITPDDSRVGIPPSAHEPIDDSFRACAA